MNLVPMFVVAVAVGVATVTDLRYLKVYNWLTFPLLAAGLTFHAAREGWLQRWRKSIDRLICTHPSHAPSPAGDARSSYHGRLPDGGGSVKLERFEGGTGLVDTTTFPCETCLSRVMCHKVWESQK